MSWFHWAQKIANSITTMWLNFVVTVLVNEFSVSIINDLHYPDKSVSMVFLKSAYMIIVDLIRRLCPMS